MLNWFTSIFLESKCPLCGRDTHGDVICPDCDRQLHQCQYPNPKQSWQQPLPLFAWGKYEGLLKRAIAATKYDHKPEVGEWLGIQMGLAWQKNNKVNHKNHKKINNAQEKSLILMPIPMHPAKQKERGFNQADLIANGFAQVNGLQCDRHSLQRIKKTQALFSLNASQRQQEIQRAFQIKPAQVKRLKRKRILLIDDIYTSGATAKEAATTLRKQGLRVIGIAAIASSKPRNLNPTK